jgi:hypothetical protein
LYPKRKSSGRAPSFISVQFQRLISPSPTSNRTLVAAVTKNHRSTISMAQPSPTFRLSEILGRSFDAVYIKLGITPLGLAANPAGEQAPRRPP